MLLHRFSASILLRGADHVRWQWQLPRGVIQPFLHSRESGELQPRLQGLHPGRPDDLPPRRGSSRWHSSGLGQPAGLVAADDEAGRDEDPAQFAQLAEPPSRTVAGESYVAHPPPVTDEGTVVADAGGAGGGRGVGRLRELDGPYAAPVFGLGGRSEPGDEFFHEFFHESGDESGDEFFNESMCEFYESNHESITESINESNHESINESMCEFYESNHESINESINESNHESINESINEFFYESNHHSNHHSTHQPTNQPLQTTQIPLSPLSQPTVSHQRGGVASPRSGTPADEHPLRRCHRILSLT